MLTKEEIDNWMARDLIGDIYEMHEKFGVYKWLQNATVEQRKELMKLRMRMLTEEYAETMNAYLEGNPEEVVDGLIDIIVIAIGTLDTAGVDAEQAWDAVHSANMDKQPGVKPGRPNPLGLPDLIKPKGWTSPEHTDNHGDLKAIFKAS